MYCFLFVVFLYGHVIFAADQESVSLDDVVAVFVQKQTDFFLAGKHQGNRALIFLSQAPNQSAVKSLEKEFYDEGRQAVLDGLWLIDRMERNNLGLCEELYKNNRAFFSKLWLLDLKNIANQQNNRSMKDFDGYHAVVVDVLDAYIAAFIFCYDAQNHRCVPLGTYSYRPIKNRFEFFSVPPVFSDDINARLLEVISQEDVDLSEAAKNLYDECLYLRDGAIKATIVLNPNQLFQSLSKEKELYLEYAGEVERKKKRLESSCCILQ